LQIKRQLEDIDSFPMDKRLQASFYLVNALFQSVSNMFESATHIKVCFHHQLLLPFICAVARNELALVVIVVDSVLGSV